MNLKQFCENNGYILKDKIDFDIDRYGNGIPSITTILKLIVDPGFDFVLDRYKDKVDEACIRGTKVHNTAEDYFNGDLSITETDTENLKYITKFHSLFVDEIIDQELRIEKDGISGTIDLIAQLNIRGKRFKGNCDYKTSKSKSAKYKVQLGGYRWLNGNPGVLVYLGNKLQIDIVEDYYTDIFIELLEYFLKLKNDLG